MTALRLANAGVSQLFLGVAPKAGLTTFRVPLPVDWNFARGEVNGTYTPTSTTEDIDFGVNNDGKHSIDVTYLKAAEATGRVNPARRPPRRGGHPVGRQR